MNRISGILFLVWLVVSGQLLGQNSLQLNVVPYPRSVVATGQQFDLTKVTHIVASKDQKENALLLQQIFDRAVHSAPAVVEKSEEKNAIFIFIEREKTVKDDESYALNINPESITITASNSTGVFYAIHTLMQIMPRPGKSILKSSAYLIPTCKINDTPRFPHRGVLLDCSRHFMSVEMILRNIDVMSHYKMNVLHWHLTDDQGWRIEIDAYPKLTEIGAWRKEEDGSTYGGFYTKEEIRQIVDYAAKHHVTVIPEIELPGHSVAAIAAYPHLSCTGNTIPVQNQWGVFKDIYCAGQESTFEFMEKVLTEVCELFPGPYIHIGGDEVPKYRWENCVHCQRRMDEEGIATEAELQTYFIQRVAEFLKTKNKSIIGWDEIMEGGTPAGAVVQSWRGMEGGAHAAREKHYAIMSPTSHCYMDYPLTSIDLEKVYLFSVIPEGLSEIESTYIRGGESNMWSEHTPEEIVETFIYPRAVALAEVLWTFPDRSTEEKAQLAYEDFYRRFDFSDWYFKSRDVKIGFPKVPISIQHEWGQKELAVTPTANLKGLQIYYSMSPFDSTENNNYETIGSGEPIILQSSGCLYLRAMGENEVRTDFQFPFSLHKGLGRGFQLSYQPSKYYPGKNKEATIVDGELGAPNFRHPSWQAVQGENMAIELDFETTTKIQKVSGQFFHYSNAWIFRPAALEIYRSDDDVKWTLVKTVSPDFELMKGGEFPILLEVSELNLNTRYIKVQAVNPGPCPAHHDAAGEKSWMFWSEVIIE